MTKTEPKDYWTERVREDRARHLEGTKPRGDDREIQMTEKFEIEATPLILERMAHYGLDFRQDLVDLIINMTPDDTVQLRRYSVREHGVCHWLPRSVIVQNPSFLWTVADLVGYRKDEELWINIDFGDGPELETGTQVTEALNKLQNPPAPEATHEQLWQVTKKLPGDFEPYGEREREDPDCSTSCRWYHPLDGAPKGDWGVCFNPDSSRAGLLTFEHQGCERYESTVEFSRPSLSDPCPREGGEHSLYPDTGFSGVDRGCVLFKVQNNSQCCAHCGAEGPMSESSTQ